MSEIQPPIYSSAMVKGTTSQVAIDPLAIWCGEVKLIPTAALEQVAGCFRSKLFMPFLEGFHGLSTLFMCFLRFSHEI